MRRLRIACQQGHQASHDGLGLRHAGFVSQWFLKMPDRMQTSPAVVYLIWRDYKLVQAIENLLAALPDVAQVEVEDQV